MNGKQIVSSLDIVLQWITRLATINILWFIFSLRGFLVGGIFPATVAVLGVSRKLIMADTEVKITSVFKQIYHQEFKNANILGWLLTIIGGLLYLNFKVIADSSGEILFVIPFAFYLVIFFYVIVILWTFPLVAHYQATWIQHIKNALIIGLTRIHYTIASGLVVLSVAYFSLDYPGLIPFFSISVAAIGSMWFSMRIFGKIDQRPA